MKYNFFVGQVLFWHLNDFEGERYIRAVVTEVHKHHAVAVTKGNEFENYNNQTLWIDEWNAEDFFRSTVLQSLKK